MTTDYGIGIFDQHAQLLRASGISVAVYDERGYVSVDTKTRLEHEGFGRSQQRVPGLLIPVHGADGGVVLHEYRPDKPRLDKNRKPVKYERPTGSVARLDVAPSMTGAVVDPAVTMYITEGARKVDSATTQGLFAVGLLGVWGFSSDKKPLKDWTALALRGRDVVIAFDADVMVNPKVTAALVALDTFLSGEGAHVRYLVLPDLGDGHTGLDDFFGAGHTVTELLDLIVDPGGGREVAPPSAPWTNAETFLEAEHGHPDHELLVFHGGQVERWNETCWVELPPAELDQQLYRFFADATYLKETKLGSIPTPFDPNRYKIADLAHAVQRRVLLPQYVTAPAWLGGSSPALDGALTARADDIIAMTNGLLHLPTRTLLAHTPTYYVNWSLPYPYAPDAPEPVRWLTFLNDLWGEDDECKRALQEWLAYLLCGDTRLQRMLMFVGPKRSGKGTICRVLRGLLGANNVAGPTLSSLSTNFGLQPLIGKPVAIVADARLTSDDNTIVERLLSISGEDTLTVDRKYRDAWTGKLPTRFVLVSNETPQLRDASGAMASRFIIIPTIKSFYEHENVNLTDELLTELPSILMWALDGLPLLRENNRFTQPKAGLDLQRELEDLGSPVATFVRERCIRQPGVETRADHLYEHWRDWCNETGRRSANAQVFGRDLRSVMPGLRVMQHADEQSKGGRYYQGIRKRNLADDDHDE